MTVELNAHGALLLLYEDVGAGQHLRLLNPTTWDEQDACVVHFAPFHNGLKFVGVKFVNPAPEFWPVRPPDGWNLAPAETTDPARKENI